MTVISLNRYERTYLISLLMLMLIVVGYRSTSKSALDQVEYPLVFEHAQVVAMEPNVIAQANSEILRAQQALAQETAPVTAAEIVDAWRFGNASLPAPAIAVPDGVSIYERVELLGAAHSHPSVGQQIILALPDGINLMATIETSATHSNGDYTWSGHINGHGTDYPVVMTYGANSVFASITAPLGSYTLASVNGSGWIYKNPSEFELSAVGGRDYLDVPVAQ